MMNPDQISARLSMMDDAALQKFAELHKNDPYVLPLAVTESNRRKQVRAAAQAQQEEQPSVADASIAQMQPEPAPAPMPPEQMAAGIPQLAARNLESMADGGIAGYAAGGVTKEEREKYRAYAMNRARQLGIDPKFVDAVFQTESGYNPNAKSKTGPVGIGQLTRRTARSLGLDPYERRDPYKNMDASMSLMQQLFRKYKDPAKVAIAYNQGEGVLNDHLKQNKGQLVPEKLYENVRTANKQEPFNYLKKISSYAGLPALNAARPVASTKPKPKREEFVGLSPELARQITEALPFASAQAGELPQDRKTKLKQPEPVQASKPTSDLRYRDVPGSPDAVEYERQLKAARPPERSYLAQRGRELLGAPEAALSLLTGGISPLTGTVYGGARTLMGKPTTAQEGAEAMTFAPRSEPGEESLAGAYRAIEDFKIPAYMPGVGTTAARPKAGKAVSAAEAAKTAAAEAKQAAETAKAPRLEGPKPATNRTLDLRKLFEEAQERSAKAAETANLLDSSVTPDGRVITGAEKAAALRSSIAQPKAFTPDPAAQQLGVEALLRRKRAEQAADVRRAQERAGKAETLADDAAVEAERAKALDRGDKTFAEARRQAEARMNTGAPFAISASVTPGAISEAEAEEAAPPVSDVYPDFRGSVADEMRRGPGATPFPTPAAEDKDEAAPVAEKKGFDDDDLLMLGLGLLSSPGGQAGGELSQLFSNLGRAGLGAIAAKREREKELGERSFKEIMGKYYTQLAKMQGRPEMEEREIERVIEQNPGMTRLQAIEAIAKAKYDPRGDVAKQIAALKAAGPLGMLPGGDTDGFTVLGKRPG